MKASNDSVHLPQTTSVSGVVDRLPASKSISNRVLIMNALGGNASVLHNLSDANDTQLMLRLIHASDQVIDVEDAGTTMRFLTAFFSVTNQDKVLTGTDRMLERPIGILVDALRALGVELRYEGKDGYPPLHVLNFPTQIQDHISLRGDVSSQFISAMMMIGPVLPKGLNLTLTGKVGSRPYIEMTASLMRQFGADVSFSENKIQVRPTHYKPIEFTIESDWSAASYWFAITALAENASVTLPRIHSASLQGDSAIAGIMAKLGVETRAGSGTISLSKDKNASKITQDFTHCPDLAQTVAVVCAAKGVHGTFTGLESLRIKETDRIAALQNELRKIGADLVESGSEWTLVPSVKLPRTASFATYKDHRMAMAFAPLATLMDVTIENPDVVRKSYPRYWDDLVATGFKVNRISGN